MLEKPLLRLFDRVPPPEDVLSRRLPNGLRIEEHVRVPRDVLGVFWNDATLELSLPTSFASSQYCDSGASA